MATFTAGTSFTDGVTGDVTAAKLNALVANATPLSNFITDRTAETSIATDDLVLISDTSDSGALNKMTVANLMKAEITGTINSTAGTITTGVIPTLTSTTLITSGTGTAASPAIVPTGDTNTGIFFPAADTIAFSEGGTESMRIDSSGRVGIGTSSPIRKLDVNGYSGNGTLAINSGSTDASTIYFANGGTGTSVYNGFIQYDHSANAMQFATNQGTERLRIDSSGNVGIGTTSPASKLDIRFSTNPSNDNGTGSNVLRIATSVSQGADIGGAIGLGGEGVGSVIFGQIAGRKENSNSSSNSGYLQFNTLNNSGTMLERLRIDSSGNVGVGTTLPTNRLHIVNSGPGALSLQTTAASSDQTQISFVGTTGNKWTIGNNAATGGTGTNFDIYDLASSANRLRIDSNGNVGVGTNSPTEQLTLSGNLRLANFVKADGDLILSADHDNNNAGTAFRVEVDATERLRITSGGVLTFAGQTETSPVVNGVAGIAIDGSNNYAAFSRSGNEAVGIGRQGSDGAAVRFYRSTTNVGNISVTATATAYNTSSDYRLKTNLEPISNGIDRIKQLPVYRFNWIADEGGNKVDGFVAHEVASIVPEAIHGTKDEIDSDGNPIYQGIDQSKIVPLLTAALKEAIAKIETLEAKVTALEAA